MLTDDLLKELSPGTVVESLTNDEYERVSIEETNPAIDKILEDYASALRDAANYFVR
jgi:hypothetical protein